MLFQQFLYNELRGSERRILHGDVGTALEALYEGQADGVTASITPQLARHFEAAGDDEKAIRYLTRALGMMHFACSRTMRQSRITHARSYWASRARFLRNNLPISIRSAGGRGN